ncbi:MAG: L-serine ammonia-lyase [SAR324 cluster bacterium]|nr:L-serine ammonia-lyase [SAR324 cluster bacterium]
MTISVFDLLKIGIGPSSSHTVGPMSAARKFLVRLKEHSVFEKIFSVRAELFGSLALTGIGHNTNTAVLLGFEGHFPSEINPDLVPVYISNIRKDLQIELLGERFIQFDESKDLIFHRDKTLPFHANGMRFSAFGIHNEMHLQQVYYSIGGGFIIEEACIGEDRGEMDSDPLPYPFKTGESLVELCKTENLSIMEIMFRNEKNWRTETEIYQGLSGIWEAMQECVRRGLRQKGVLPGGLNVKRRAPELYQVLSKDPGNNQPSLTDLMDWVSLYALAVNEENAAGGRVVTAPTNGAAGVIPAVMHYYDRFIRPFNRESLANFLLTAAAIGILYKEGASISAAEMGCQGEIGVACSMAAAGLTAVCGGFTTQITNAAEIGMEHNLGLTCDPVGGLVQIPCIERNTMGAIKAIAASNLALRGDGSHVIPLDKVIQTMRKTGEDMLSHYKETSLGGLAVSFIEC